MCQRKCRFFYYWLIVILLSVTLISCQEDKVAEDVIASVEDTAVPTNTIQPTSIPPTQTPEPTFTPTPVPTETNTAVPTNTCTPKPSPTATTTPTRFSNSLPTPDPLTINAETVQLVDWSPDDAHNLALLMEGYKDMMNLYFNDSITENIYYNSFLPASLAYAEARLQYPNNNQVEQWHLAETANRVISEYGIGSQLYQDLIAKTLNESEVTIEALSHWFAQYEVGYSLQIDSLQPLPGYKNSYLISIHSHYDIGNTTFWLLETEDGFLTYPLFSNLADTVASYYAWEIVDLTGDGIDDLLISAGSHNGSMIGEESAFYDLSLIPPKQLGLGPEPPWSQRYSRSTSSQINENDQIEVQMLSGDILGCPAWVTSIFRWNGQWLELVDFEISDEEADFSYCSYTFREKNWRSFTELEQNKILEWFPSEFGDIKPTGTDWRTDEPFLPDAQDDYRFLLAMNHAVLGNIEESHNYLDLIINTPAITESQWIEPAETFLSIYQSPQDVYKACKATNLSCDLHLAVERVASTLSLGVYEDAIAQLVGLGVPVLANGRFDFDNDRTPEHWFIVQHQPGDDYELWILAASNVHLKAMFVDTVTNLQPTLLLHTANDPSDSFPFTIGNDAVYNFIRRLRDQEPYVTKLDAFEPYIRAQSPERVSLDQAIDDLLSGTNPEEVLARLQTLADNPNFEPHNRYYYYLGLTYELLGDEDAAVNAYLLAWQDCCDTWFNGNVETVNPYAIMAQAKLEPVP